MTASPLGERTVDLEMKMLLGLEIMDIKVRYLGVSDMVFLQIDLEKTNCFEG